LRMHSLLLLTLVASALGVREFPTHRLDSVDKPFYETKYFDAYRDNFDPTLKAKFQVKYLINKKYFTDDGTGPLFFYTGNEGTIETFADNTGILYDIAPEFKALIVFCEHRYYGNGSSMPFGKDSFKDINKVKFLTVEQALGDFATLIDILRVDYNFTQVIAFGGSYGGMLSAWFRTRYPKVVDGAWAASAPVAYFRNSDVPMGAFDRVVSRTMTRFGCNQDAVVDALKKLDSCTFNFLNRLFNVDPRSLIQTRDDVAYLKGYIREGFEYMAMTDYPYPANFLRPLGAWPMLSACTNLSSTFQRPEDGAKALKDAMDAFYDPRKPACFKPGCGDSATAGLGDLYGWTWQSCTELPIDICAQGPPSDPFWVDCTKTKVRNDVPTFEEYLSDSCDDLRNTITGYDSSMIQWDAVERSYGFDLEGTTNLILTQGYLDPWSAGGALIDPKTSAKRNVYMYEIDGAAHHLDLRVPNTCDPPTVTSARYQIVNILKCWTGLATYGCDNPQSLQWQLPEWKGPEMRTDCADIVQGYPWGLSGPGRSTSQPQTASTSAGNTGNTGSTASGATGAPPGTGTTAKTQQSPTPSNSASKLSFSFLLVLLSVRLF
jgi:pimeloyl-ACP methyl ester carboxylesterase